MALATLCSKLQDKGGQDDLNVRFRAFVVDHRVRDGSGDEAHAVAEVLGKKGALMFSCCRYLLTMPDIPTDVLNIQWPEGLDAKEAPNFESLARTYRFQALGRACRNHQIKSLFLAHHRDDQAETVLMRMMNGHRKNGLCGMRLSADIPECRGLYGVHQSGCSGPGISLGGKTEIDIATQFRVTNSSDSSKHALVAPPSSMGDMWIESGGIRIYRPLLGFSKKELRDTCEIDGMPWFEDHTNVDPTLTTRNAIRHIYANYKLPVALQKASILALAKRLQERRDEEAENRSRISALKLQIMEFQPRVPYCSIYFEPLNMGYHAKQLASISSTVLENTSLWLRAAIQMVSPIEQIPLKTLSTAVQRVYPELDSQSINGQATRKPFTVAGVMFEPVRSNMHEAVPFHTHPGYKWTAREDSSPIPHRVADRTWIIKPQPFVRGKEPRLRFIPFQGRDERAYWDDPESWKLYDGRFWIRLLNLTSSNIYVRPFQPHDVSKLKGTAFMTQLEQRERELLYFKTAKVRYVLPVIVADIDGVEHVVALPSLNIGVPGFETLVKYQINYRSLDVWDNTQIDP